MKEGKWTPSEGYSDNFRAFLTDAAPLQVLLGMVVLIMGECNEIGVQMMLISRFNPRVLSTNRVDLGSFLFHKFPSFTTPPPPLKEADPLS